MNVVYLFKAILNYQDAKQQWYEQLPDFRIFFSNI